MTTQETQSPWRELATAALQHAIDARWDQARESLQQLVADHGSAVIPWVMLAWIDTMLGQAYPNRRPGDPVRLGIVNAADGRVGPQDPAQQWAGWAISARAADDYELFKDLVASVQTDQQWTDSVWQVLNMCGTTIRVRAVQVGRHVP